MKNLNDALAERVNEFAGLPTPAATQNPLMLANICQDLENEVMALDAIALGIGDGNADPLGQAAAIRTPAVQRPALRLFLRYRAGLV